jgi:hypothetical protein
MLIVGVAGFVIHLLLITIRRDLLSRRNSTIIIIALFVIVGTGLVLVTTSTGGRSLHTGG